jgi:hypothetical protein
MAIYEFAEKTDILLHPFIKRPLKMTSNGYPPQTGLALRGKTQLL